MSATLSSRLAAIVAGLAFSVTLTSGARADSPADVEGPGQAEFGTPQSSFSAPLDLAQPPAPPPAATAANSPSPHRFVHGDCCCEDRLERAGRPDFIAHWAHCSYGRKNLGYYVGGGAPLYSKRATCLCGEPRYPHEGTFGVDYDPWWSRVRLQWYHGKRFQGGEGQYAPDGCNNPFCPK